VRTAHADGEDSGGCGTACKQPLGAILARPREYLVRVVLPSLGAWLAKLGVIAVFLATGSRSRSTR
jgi:hypothetical protein